MAKAEKSTTRPAQTGPGHLHTWVEGQVGGGPDAECYCGWCTFCAKSGNGILDHVCEWPCVPWQKVKCLFSGLQVACCPGCSDFPGGRRKGPCFQARRRPGQIHCGLSAFSAFQALGLFFVPLAWAPSTCSQRACLSLPGVLGACPSVCLVCLSAGNWEQLQPNPPSVGDCLTDSAPIFLAPLPNTHRTLPCRHSSQSSNLVDFAAHHRTASFSLSDFHL